MPPIQSGPPTCFPTSQAGESPSCESRNPHLRSPCVAQCHLHPHPHQEWQLPLCDCNEGVGRKGTSKCLALNPRDRSQSVAESAGRGGVWHVDMGAAYLFCCSICASSRRWSQSFSLNSKEVRSFWSCVQSPFTLGGGAPMSSPFRHRQAMRRW